jgi:hypothetical protein
MSTLILFAHPTFGVLGILAAVWVFVEALNASESNASRIRLAAAVVAVCIFAAYVLGGYWYTHFYAADKAIILKGPWPWAHSFFMETKEHLFFIPLILALYLAIAASQKLVGNRSARAMVMSVAALIVLSGLAIEGAGAVISNGVKVTFVQPATPGAE